MQPKTTLGVMIRIMFQPVLAIALTLIVIKYGGAILDYLTSGMNKGPQTNNILNPDYWIDETMTFYIVLILILMNVSVFRKKS